MEYIFDVSLKNQRQDSYYIDAHKTSDCFVQCGMKIAQWFRTAMKFSDVDFFTADTIRFMEQRSIYYKMFNANTAHNALEHTSTTCTYDFMWAY